VSRDDVTTPEPERAARGRAERKGVSRPAQSQLAVAPDRDAIALLEAQAATRVADLVPIRYGRMLRTPFTFFRGAAVVMAHDLAATSHTGLYVQLCGDAHLLNFGGFASPERDLVFDLNDFDETLPGPFEWDVKRLAASVEIAARERGLDDGARAAALSAAGRSYRETMWLLARQGELDAWYARADEASLLADLHAAHEPGVEKAVEHGAAHARENDSAHALAKLTRLVDGEPRIVAKPPLIVPVADLGPDRDEAERTVQGLFPGYRRSLPRDRRGLLDRFRYADLARKVVGIGSVGTRCWMLLLLGRDVDDPLFLQVKEAQASVLEPFMERSAFQSHAERIVEGQRLAQAAGDIFLGWTRVETADGTQRDYYVRQLRDWKASLDIGLVRPEGLASYSRWCGAALARAHARSGDRIAIAAYLGKSDAFDQAVAAFATSYAAVNERDHASLRRAVDEGRVAAVEGV
jgi:uncharacterized protein (DUF2252 family)